MTKSGFAALFGKPNAGKSTLLNAMLEYRLSAVNRKKQTTRDRIAGILTEKNYQIVFVDMPGHLEPQYELQKFMAAEIRTSLEEADVLLHVADAVDAKPGELKNALSEFSGLIEGKKKFLVLNKIDLMKKDEVIQLIGELSSHLNYDEIIPVSALKNENIDELKKTIVKYLPEAPFFYDKDTLTDKPEKFFVAEIIREKILSLYHEEIPYSVFVKIAEFKPRSAKLVYINAEIILERESQKAIFIGAKGEGLRRLGESARKDIERFLRQKVYLELFVKVRKGWRNNRKLLRELYK